MRSYRSNAVEWYEEDVRCSSLGTDGPISVCGCVRFLAVDCWLVAPVACYVSVRGSGLLVLRPVTTVGWAYRLPGMSLG
jgi:hypothetical protein